jgi:steroid delta-isomerase-like uncharacterized protein
MTANEMVTIAREQVDAFNESDWKKMRGQLAADSRYHELGSQRSVKGSQEIVALFQDWKKAFPDATGKVTSALGSGNKVALEVVWKGTQTGPLGGPKGTIAPSGKQQVTPAALFFTFQGNKIKESHQYFDSMTLLQQIGALPK